MTEEGKLRVVGEEEPYLLTSCETGRYEFSIGRGESYSKLLEKPRVYYDLSVEDFERLANTGVVNLEAELGKINPAATDRLKDFMVDWNDLSMFLGKCSIDEEDRGKLPGKDPPYDATTFSKIMKDGRDAATKANEGKILGLDDFDQRRGREIK